MYEDVVPETPESMELEGRDDDGRPEVLILEDHHQPGILEAALRCDHGSPVPFDPLAPSKPEWSFAGGGRPGSMDDRPRPRSSGGGRLKKKPADFPIRGDEPPQRPKTSSGPRPKTPRANRPPSGGAFRQPPPARRPATADGAVAVRAAPRPGSARGDDDSPFLAGPAELVLSGVEELLRAFHEAGLEKRDIAAPADVVRRFLAAHYGGDSGQQKGAKFPTSKAHISAVFHSFRLIFGRAIISRNGLEARMLFPERSRAEHSH